MMKVVQCLLLVSKKLTNSWAGNAVLSTITNNVYALTISLIRISGPGWLNEFSPGFVNYEKGALDSQPQVIQFTSYLPMVGGSLWILRLLPPLTLVAMI
jgi:hypothetical protein